MSGPNELTGITSNPVKEALDRLLAARPEQEKSYEERVAEVAEELPGWPTVEALRSHAAAVLREMRSRYITREKILSNPDLVQDARVRRVAAHDTESDAVLIKWVGAAEAQLAKMRAMVLPEYPTFAAATAAEAAADDSMMLDYPHLSPTVAIRQAENTRAKGKLSLMRRQRDMLESMQEYRPAFASAAVHREIDALNNALATPETIRSAAIKQWLEAATVDVRSFTNTLRNECGNLDKIYQTVGAFGTLFTEPVEKAA